MAITTNLSVSTTVSETHTINQFLTTGESEKTVIGYNDLSYIETIDNIEYTIKNLVSDYLYLIQPLAIPISLSDTEQIKYKYNPKLLSYDTYKTTRLFYVILALNGICNVHEFDFAIVNMLKVDDMNTFLTNMYSAEKTSMTTYNNNHKNDTLPTSSTIIR